MRVHFSNLILLFLAANALLGLEFIPILRKVRMSDGPFTSIGSGWPMQCVDAHANFFIGETVFNAVYLLGMLFWFWMLLEKRNGHFRFKAVDVIGATVLSLIIFGGLVCRNTMDMGFSYSYPWWEAWRAPLFLFFSGLMGMTVLRFTGGATVDHLAEKLNI